jgi:hypothetical protein
LHHSRCTSHEDESGALAPEHDHPTKDDSIDRQFTEYTAADPAKYWSRAPRGTCSARILPEPLELDDLLSVVAGKSWGQGVRLGHVAAVSSRSRSPVSQRPRTVQCSAMSARDGDLRMSTVMPVTITNKSDKRSDYWIEIAADRPDGTRITTGSLSVYNLEPGQSTTQDALFWANDDPGALPHDTVFKLLSVQRTVSV